MNYFYNIDGKETAKYKILIIRIFGIAGMIIGVIASLFAIASTFPKGLVSLVAIPMLMYEFAAIPAGWWKMNSITSDSFDSFPVVGWLIYVTYKFTIGYLVGLVALPSEYKRLKKILND